MTGLILTQLLARIVDLRTRRSERNDDGYSTETILVTAVLVGIGLAVLGVISVKLLAKANGIDLDGTP